MPKKQRLFESWADASFSDMLRFQVRKVLNEPRTPVLWMIEVLLAVGIATSIAIYLDPDVNVVPFPWNMVAFAALVGAALWIHRRTRPFRVAKRVRKSRSTATKR